LFAWIPSMKPVTRRTLLRILLAISLYSKGHTAAAWYCLPRKYKCYAPEMAPVIRHMGNMLLEILPRMYQEARKDLEFMRGDTWAVRPPRRVA